ncbi:MAG: hypothetical protein U0002_13270 [Thermoanaerobaculia bacterium]
MKRNLILTLTCLALFAAPGVTRAEDEAEKSWSLGASVDRATIYLFRGSDLLGNEPVIFPSVRYGYGGLSLSYYGYFGDIKNGGNYAEADFLVDYTFSLGDKVSVTLGGLTYQFNHDAERDLAFLDTYEYYAIVGFDVPLSPTLSFYRDFDKVNGGYLTLSLSHSFPLGSKASLDLSGAYSLDFHYNNKAKGNGTPNDLLFGLNIPWQINDRFSVHAQLQRSIALESLDARREADPSLTESSEDETIFTVGGAVSF